MLVDILVYAIYFIVGAVMGSFTAAVAYRVCRGISIVSPPSRCDRCERRLRWFENIPIVSFIIQGGKCRTCGAKIGVLGFLAEVITAVLYLLVAIVFFKQGIALSIVLCLTLSVLITIALSDIYTMYISNIFMYIFLFLGVCVVLLQPIDLLNNVIGVAIGGGLLLLVYGVGYLIKKREVMGLADIKLMAVAGLMLGWKGVLFALFVGIIFACVVLGIKRVVEIVSSRKTAKQNDSEDKEHIKDVELENKEYPFAPYLVVGIIAAIFVGDLVFNLYLSLFI